MKINDLIMMSVRNLWRRKLRTCLTVLGVVIGACSIILMLSLGIAMNANFEKQMEGMGSLTIIEVQPGNYGDPKAPKLDDKAIDQMSRLPGVQRVIPDEYIRAYLEFGKYRTSWQVNIKPLDAVDAEALGYKVEQGRDMVEEDKTVILLGSEVTRQFIKRGQKLNWNAMPPAMAFELGQDKIKINLAELDYQTGKPVATTQEGKSVKVPKLSSVTVVGTYSENDWETSNYAFIPRLLYEKLADEQKKYNKDLYGKEQNNDRYNNGNKYEGVKVKVTDRDLVVEVQNSIKELGYSAYSPMEYLEEMKKVSASMQVILGGIGAISLFVAAIGITNTMMMSIYERTREIGIMKVIGAKITDIKKMFLVEALLIGALGGLVGVVFSYMLSVLINHFGPQIAASMMMGGGDKISIIPPWLALAALAFSTLIGLISGYFPAKRAMKLSALSAIKTE